MNGLMTKIKKSLVTATPSIDYPQEGEEVKEGAYAIRVSAEPANYVEISINNGDWLPCRPAAGYWWFDWMPLGAGHCKIVARTAVTKGTWKKSKERTCKVEGSHSPLNVGLTFD